MKVLVAITEPERESALVETAAALACGGEVVLASVIEVTGDRGRLGSFTGDIAADSVTYVGRVDLDGVKEASVTLEHPVLGRVGNRYDAALLASVREEARS